MEKPQPNEIEANSYPADVEAPSLSVPGISVNVPAVAIPESNVAPVGSGSILKTGVLKSPNYALGVSGWQLNSNGSLDAYTATLQSSPADPTATTSTTGVMMGLAGSITPYRTGRIQIIISGDIDNNTVADGAQVQIRYGTGTAPANAAALTGTVAGGLVKITNGATDTPRFAFSLNALVSSLIIGTAYWIDLSLAATVGGTARIRDLSLTIIEI